MSAVAAVPLKRMLPPEEAARADFYALLAALFVAPPDAGLLARLAGAQPIESEGALARAWGSLVMAGGAALVALATGLLFWLMRR